MTELTDHVERAVRPVRASRARKRRMRQELLAHLSAAFEEERIRIGDERLALARAVGRFGDAAELTRELQASVPWLESALFFDFPRADWFDRRATAALHGTGRTPWRDAVLLAGLLAAMTFVLLVLLPLIEVAGGKDWSAARLPWDVTAVLTGLAFVSGLLCVGYIRAVAGRPGAAALVRAATWGAAAVLWGAAMVPALALAKPDGPLWVGPLRPPGWTVGWAVGTWVFLVALAVVSRSVDAREPGPAAVPAAG